MTLSNAESEYSTGCKIGKRYTGTRRAVQKTRRKVGEPFGAGESRAAQALIGGSNQ